MNVVGGCEYCVSQKNEPRATWKTGRRSRCGTVPGENFQADEDIKPNVMPYRKLPIKNSVARDSSRVQ